MVQTKQKTTPVHENKMGTMPVPKLLISMSLPMMLSMLVQALYNIVDSMFVAKLSEDALTAVSLAFPIPDADDRCRVWNRRWYQRTSVP